MVSQQKSESTLQERINVYQRDSKADNGTPAMPDTAGDLVDALDTLLLERALEEHRTALARLTELKLALGKAQAK